MLKLVRIPDCELKYPEVVVLIDHGLTILEAR